MRRGGAWRGAMVGTCSCCADVLLLMRVAGTRDGRQSKPRAQLRAGAAARTLGIPLGELSLNIKMASDNLLSLPI